MNILVGHIWSSHWQSSQKLQVSSQRHLKVRFISVIFLFCKCLIKRCFNIVFFSAHLIQGYGDFILTLYPSSVKKILQYIFNLLCSYWTNVYQISWGRRFCGLSPFKMESEWFSKKLRWSPIHWNRYSDSFCVLRTGWNINCWYTIRCCYLYNCFSV